MRKVWFLGMALAIAAGTAGCVVEDETPDGGGGGTTVIERDRVIERDKAPTVIEKDNDPDVINVQPAPAPQHDGHDDTP